MCDTSVLNWLQDAGLEAQAQIFVKAGYGSEEKFVNIHLEDFPQLGITSHAQRVALYKIIQVCCNCCTKVDLKVLQTIKNVFLLGGKRKNSSS